MQSSAVKRKITSKLQRKSTENSPAKKSTSISTPCQLIYGLTGGDIEVPQDARRKMKPLFKSHVKSSHIYGDQDNEKKLTRSADCNVAHVDDYDEQTNDDHAAAGQNFIIRDDLLYMADCILKARTLSAKSKRYPLSRNYGCLR